MPLIGNVTEYLNFMVAKFSGHSILETAKIFYTAFTGHVRPCTLHPISEHYRTEKARPHFSVLIPISKSLFSTFRFPDFHQIESICKMTLTPRIRPTISTLGEGGEEERQNSRMFTTQYGKNT